jgi:hypothetical protein
MEAVSEPAPTSRNGGVQTLIPEPTAKFTSTLQQLRVGGLPGPALPKPLPIPFPIPLFKGARFLIWKQDPTVTELGPRLVYIPGLVLKGPRDARIITELPGTTPVSSNGNGDFIFPAGSAEMDCAHTFAVVRQTLTLFTRLRGGTAIPWAWNTGGNTQPISVYPRAGVTPNAYYSRNERALRFFYFTPTGSSTQVYTCRSLDIVAHECGHAILDGLRPGWLAWGNPPQTGGLHESFGDLAAIFLALSQLDQVEAAIAMTKGDLHDKNFLAALAEQFGTALGRPLGLRNADNDLKLSEVGNEVHAISQVFTGAIYDILADIYAFERNAQAATKDPAQVLLEVGRHVAKLVIDAIVLAPATAATYADVANRMLQVSAGQGDPPIYRTFIRNRFSVREVVVSPVPLAAIAAAAPADLADANYANAPDDLAMPAMAHVSDNLPQDRSQCCPTMSLPEFMAAPEDLARGVSISDDDLLAPEVERLVAEFRAAGERELVRS